MDQQEATGQPGQPNQPEQAEQPKPRPPGWYARADKSGATWFWDGRAWGEENPQGPMAAYEAKVEARRRQNTKLSTIAALAIISPIIGLLVLIFRGGDQGWTMIGISLLGFGLSMWVTWLAFGAVVDEVRRLRESS